MGQKVRGVQGVQPRSRSLTAVDGRRIRNGMSNSFRPIVAAVMLLLAPALVLAQAPAGPGAPGQGRGGGRGGPGQTVEKIRPLKPNLYMVTGGGANTLVRVTTD